MKKYLILLLLSAQAFAYPNKFVTQTNVFTGEAASGFTNGSIPFIGSNTLTQNNSQLFWDNTNFRLGIGTASPNYNIQILSKSGNPAEIFAANSDFVQSSSGSGFYIQEFASSGTTYAEIQSFSGGNSVPAPLVLNQSGGNVGVNNISPSYQLDVGGTMRASTNIIDNGIPTSAAGAPLSITSGQVLTYGVTTSEVPSSSSLAIGTGTSVIGGATVTPAAGSYLVLFSATASASSAGGNVLTVELYVGGTGQADTIRKIMPQSSAALAVFQNMSLSLNKVVTVNGSQAIAIEGGSSAGTVTLTGLDFDIVRTQ